MRIKNYFLPLLFSFAIFTACQDEILIKPSAKLRLDYPTHVYQLAETDCPFTFEMNKNATLVKKPNCGININYPKMKATLYMTYQTVTENNLDSLLRDAQKLAYEHTIKANSIPEQPFINPDKKVYGMFYMINGNAATQGEFYVTDSISHFLTGAVYFEAKPNFDSIYPAAMYLREDMRRLMETINWK